MRGWLDESATEHCGGLDFACALGPVFAGLTVIVGLVLFAMFSLGALPLLALWIRSGLLAGHLALLVGIAGAVITGTGLVAILVISGG